MQFNLPGSLPPSIKLCLHRHRVRWSETDNHARINNTVRHRRIRVHCFPFKVQGLLPSAQIWLLLPWFSCEWLNIGLIKHDFTKTRGYTQQMGRLKWIQSGGLDSLALGVLQDMCVQGRKGGLVIWSMLIIDMRSNRHAHNQLNVWQQCNVEYI